jgi:hypothetical protein
LGSTLESLLDQISDPQYKKSEHLFGPATQENQHLVGHSDNDNNQQDEVDIIDSFFADPDVYYTGESTQQDTDVTVSHNLESANQVIRQPCMDFFYLLHSVIPTVGYCNRQVL